MSHGEVRGVCQPNRKMGQITDLFRWRNDLLHRVFKLRDTGKTEQGDSAHITRMDKSGGALRAHRKRDRSLSGHQRFIEPARLITELRECGKTARQSRRGLIRLDPPQNNFQPSPAALWRRFNDVNLAIARQRSQHPIIIAQRLIDHARLVCRVQRLIEARQICERIMQFFQRLCLTRLITLLACQRQRCALARFRFSVSVGRLRLVARAHRIGQGAPRLIALQEVSRHIRRAPFPLRQFL